MEISSKEHHTYNNNMKYEKTVPLNQVVMTIYRNRQESSVSFQIFTIKHAATGVAVKVVPVDS